MARVDERLPAQEFVERPVEGVRDRFDAGPHEQQPKGPLIADIEKQMREDTPIWENKVYHERPLLCDGDGPIAQYRRWARQFYSEEAAR